MRIQRTNLHAARVSGNPMLRMLMSGELTVAKLRAARPLPEDAEKLIDDAVVRVGRDRLVIVQDVIDEGLVFNLGQDFWGISQVQWDEINESGGAHRTMDPLARGENQLPDRRGRNIPIYLTWDDFEIGVRLMAASQRSGQPIDVTQVEQATRRVNEAIEDAMINGLDFNVFGNTVPGLLNAPNVNAFTYGSNEAWTAAGHSGQDILADVLGMIDLVRTDRMFGPYNLYVNTAYGNKLNQNFGDAVNTQPITIRQRLEQIVAGGRNLRIREADLLPTDRTILLQMTSNVVDVVLGQVPTAVSWEHPSGWLTEHKVLACAVPRVKTTYENQSGIITGNV